MWKPRWLLAMPLVLAATVGAARASSVRDRAGMFSPDAVKKAEAQLSRVERDTQLNTTIETVDSLDGDDPDTAARKHAERAGEQGLFVFIARKEGKIRVLSSRSYRRALNETRLRSIDDAFISEFKKRDFDAGLLAGVRAIGTEASSARSEFGTLREGRGPAAVGRAGVPVRRANPNGGFGLGSLLGIGLLVLGVLFVARLLGALFRGGSGSPGYPGRMGGPAYGGGGGGFMSGLFGGLGGALAGNWLYDQFSGRHHGGTMDQSSYSGDPSASTGADDWSGGASAGGDWGGGDGGGGGVGGDWGGGGGGGDWGGGGGGGGDW